MDKSGLKNASAGRIWMMYPFLLVERLCLLVEPFLFHSKLFHPFYNNSLMTGIRWRKIYLYILFADFSVTSLSNCRWQVWGRTRHVSMLHWFINLSSGFLSPKVSSFLISFFTESWKEPLQVMKISFGFQVKGIIFLFPSVWGKNQ